MDPRAFDELAKQLGTKTSRGQALKLFGGNEWLRERTIRCAAIRAPIGAKPLLA